MNFVHADAPCNGLSLTKNLKTTGNIPTHCKPINDTSLSEQDEAPNWISELIKKPTDNIRYEFAHICMFLDEKKISFDRDKIFKNLLHGLNPIEDQHSSSQDISTHNSELAGDIKEFDPIL